MLQTLFYIPCEYYGLPVFGLGLLLAVWAVASLMFVAGLVRRQGFNADTGSYVQLLSMLGLAIAFVLPMLCEARGLPIRGYGMMMLLAVLSGMGLAAYRARRVGVDPEMIFTLAFWLILPGILGARAVYVCEYWTRDFWPAYQHGLGALLFSIFNVAAGGLVDGRVRLPGDDILMGLETLVDVRREHIVAEHELARDVEVRLGLAVRNVGVRGVRRAPAAERRLLVESVHLAVRARDAAGAVARGEVRRGVVVDAPRRLQRNRPQRDRLPLGIHAARDRVGARVPLEEVVERAVLLHDDHHVLDLRSRRERRVRRGNDVRGRSRGKHRQHRVATTTKRTSDPLA